MFPRPIERSSRAAQVTYQAFLPLALLMWLAPLLAVALFSMKPDVDFTTGNYWGLPSRFAGFENYGRVFFESDMPRYLMNSVFITVPTVIGAVALSCMTGFALGVYRFSGNIWIFFMFVAGNFVPFQILMVPVRDLTLNLGLYNTIPGLVLFHIAFQTGFCTLFMRNFIRQLPRELIEAARVEGVAEWRIFWFVVLPLDEARHRGARRPHLHLYLERLLLGRGPDTGGREPARHRRHHLLQRAVPRRLPPDERGQHRRRPAPRHHVLRHAEALHRRPHPRGRQVGMEHAPLAAAVLRPDRTWRLDDARQTLALASTAGRLPCVIHWGARLPDGEDLAALAAATAPDVTGGMLDANPDLSICPEASRSFPGQAGLTCRAHDGAPLLPTLRLGAVEERPGGLTVHAADDALGLRYEARFDLDPETNVLAASARLTSDAPLRLGWLAAPVLPGPQLSDEMIDVAGRWCGEFRLQRTPWSAGIRLREGRTGRTGHEHFPGLILPARGATNTQGEAHALHYGWSGGHRMVAEELPDGRRQVQFGHAAGTEPGPATAFETATLHATFSDAGLNGAATAFQRHVRDRIVTGAARPRPVHYNCWEAVYFEHSMQVLADIATRAARLGAERFVLDDGWFGGAASRDDDTTSLGDWQVDPRKWPDGLGPLIAHVRAAGMEFGLWVEPEMASPDSDLLRAHPDWALGPADQTLGRHQLALDMARPEVRGHLFERLGALLAAHEIAYLKWDHNRVLPHPDAAQTRGSYALLGRLRAAFPQVEIESCASGGGRIDFGILARTQRVWLSDSNDALERLRMQHDAALFLPAAVTGSHVGPRTCHTSGRTLRMSFRAWVAAQRHMGFEMDPRELTEEEEAVLRDVTAWWKANRDWLIEADILRLDSADPAVIAEQQTARDASRFVLFAGRAAASAQIAPRSLRLTRLEPDARYRVTLRNRAEASHLSRAPLALKDGPLVLTGQALMHAGLALPWSHPETMWVIEGQRL